MKKGEKIQEMVERLQAGDRRAAARLITWVENGVDHHNEAMRLVYPHAGHAMILGVTGSGGVGKSTLIDHLIRRFRQQDKTVGVVVVDPTSPFSGGAFLGDRLRIQKHTQDEGVFIRSLASRGYLGGLSRATYDVIRIMEAMGKEIVIVETLGAGQDEIDIIHIAHTCLLVVTPGMGDDIQVMKAGIMEIADIIVMNKSDLDGANNCLRYLQSALSAGWVKEAGWTPRVIPTVSVASKPEDIRGIDELMTGIAEHQEYLHKNRTIERMRFKRVEYELGLIFQDELQKAVFKGLRGTGKRRKYIKGILEAKTDPYTVVDEVMRPYIKGAGEREKERA